MVKKKKSKTDDEEWLPEGEERKVRSRSSPLVLLPKKVVKVVVKKSKKVSVLIVHMMCTHYNTHPHLQL